MFHVLALDVTPESTERLGNRNEEKKRPIRMKMRSLNEKKMVMGSLGKLKTAPENLRKINVTDDYTIDERQLIKNKVTEARRLKLRGNLFGECVDPQKTGFV